MPDIFNSNKNWPENQNPSLTKDIKPVHPTVFKSKDLPYDTPIV